MTEVIDTSHEVIDSRDLIERIEQLTEYTEYNVLTVEESKELDSITTFAASIEEYAEDFTYGVSIIREDYFTEYMKSYLVDIDGETFENLPDYIRDNLNWEGIAEDHKIDYSAVTLDGVTYYVR